MTQPAQAKRPLRILAVDDQAIVCEALGTLLSVKIECNVILAFSGAEACDLIKKEEFDVVLLDVQMPEMDGVETLRRIRGISPTTPVVMLSGYDGRADVVAAIDAGACAYLLKGVNSQHLKAAVEHAVSGEGIYLDPLVSQHALSSSSSHERLTARELVVLGYLRDGATNDEIATALSVSRKTVKSQLSSVFRKLGVANRTEALAKAIGAGLLTPNHPGSGPARRPR